MPSLNDLSPTIVGYAVTGRITWGHLVGDDIPSWRYWRFEDLATADAWMRENQNLGSWIAVPVITRGRAHGAVSITRYLDSMGAPEPTRSLNRQIDDLFKHGAADVDGGVFLDDSWRFDEILKMRGRRERYLDVDSQLRSEIGALEEAYKGVHRHLPPAVIWRSRQVSECLLLAAEKHRDEIDRLSPANERAWAFYEWRVCGLAAISMRIAGTVAMTKSSRVGEDRFENRARWLRDQLSKRAWSKHRLAEFGGPTHRTTQKVLDGHRVLDDVLRKIADGLTAYPDNHPRFKVRVEDIPID